MHAPMKSKSRGALTWEVLPELPCDVFVTDGRRAKRRDTVTLLTPVSDNSGYV